MRLSKYVTMLEAIKSQQAERLGIDNTPTPEHLEAMKYVAKVIFDPCREHIGGPLGVSSFYRSPQLNAAVRGSKSSQHMKGQAIDIDCDIYGNGNNRSLFDYIAHELPFDQLIWEFGTNFIPAWVHASAIDEAVVGRKNRGEVLRAYVVEGDTRYVPFDLYAIK